MPFEISIDTKKKRGVMKFSTIEKIDELQQVLAEYPEISKSLSIADVVKLPGRHFTTAIRAITACQTPRN